MKSFELGSLIVPWAQLIPKISYFLHNRFDSYILSIQIERKI